MKKVRYVARVLQNAPVSSICMRMELSCPPEIASSVPGQFVMLDLSGKRGAALLPRPFSIYKTSSNPYSFEILYKVVGRSTQAMASLSVGDTVGVTGPLGNGFSLPEETKRCFLAAGGIGVPPIAFLARKISKTRADVECRVFLGCATSGEVLCKDEFIALGMETRVATEDGSEGACGLVTDALASEIERTRPDIVFACGPLRMLEAVGRLCGKKGISCQVSIETVMACGIGACMGCAVPAAGGGGSYLHACKDGPVFEYGSIDLAKMI